MLDGPGLCGADGSHSVQRLSQGVHHPAQHGLAHRHIGRPARSGHDAALPQAGLLAQQDTAHTVPGQIHDHALNAGLKLHQFSVDCPVQALDLGDPITHAEDPADLLDLAHRLKILDPGLEILDQAAHVAAVLHLKALDLGLQALYQALQFLAVRVKIALEALGQPLQPPPDAAVINHALDLQAKAAQNGWVDLDLKDHTLQSTQAAHRPAQILQGGLIRLPGAGDHAHRAPLGRQFQLPQLPQDGRQTVQRPLLQQQEDKGGQLLLPRQHGRRADQFLLLLSGCPGPIQRRPQHGVRHQGLGGLLQPRRLLLHLIEDRGAALDRIAHFRSPASDKNCSAMARSES